MISQFLSIALLFSFIVSVLSHAVLEFPAPRKGEEVEPGFKINNFPPTADQLSQCVGLGKTPGAVSSTFESGATIDVKWKITIPHKSDPGVRIAVQFPGEAFTVLVDNIDVNKVSVSVNLPAGKSGTAVLQWMWATQEDGGFYMGCSDILVNAGAAKASPASSPQVIEPSPSPAAVIESPKAVETPAATKTSKPSPTRRPRKKAGKKNKKKKTTTTTTTIAVVTEAATTTAAEAAVTQAAAKEIDTAALLSILKEAATLLANQ
ncbi:hypothetical protein HK098_002173 [Nowakowskiella sp. JEL0407]|nr:hypothetical protein HK098_002173 [Nowakowskiella sp. JEL0407]